MPRRTAPPPDVLERLAHLEQQNSELHREVALLRRQQPATPIEPKAEPRWRTLPGQIGEFDCNGNQRIPTGSSANVDPSTTTVGGAFGQGGGSSQPKTVVLADGRSGWRDATGLIRDRSSGEILTAAKPDPAVMPEPAYNHQLAIEHSERLFPIRPMRPPEAEE